ncbi:uncharacterized protein LOC143031000 isoform X2 [Oratosquilla oratoria]|uniref:uncharacterized protein LOC143031000 isoform X2 n=1 Tax=Oratosquilla oratoria TaxID=337810 RepID=UPI003F774518
MCNFLERTIHFPKDEVLRQAWLKAIQREDFVPTKYSRLCSDHFREESFDRTSLHYVRLRDGAIPSIFTTVQESLKRKKRQKKKIPKKHEKKLMVNIHKKHDMKVRPRRTTVGSSYCTSEIPQCAGLQRDEPETQYSWRKQKLKNPTSMKMNKDGFEASDHGAVEHGMETVPCILEEVYIKEEPVDQSGLEPSPLLRNAGSCRRKSPLLDRTDFISSREVKEEPLSMENDEDDSFGATYVKEPCIKEELVIKEEPVDENNAESSPMPRTTESCTSDGGHPDNSQKGQSASSDPLHPWTRGAAVKEAWLKMRNCHHDALRRQKKLKCASGPHAVVFKQWKYRQQIEFLVPYMTNRETSSNVTWTDNRSQQTVEGDVSLDKEMSAPHTTTWCESLTPGEIHNFEDGESIVYPSGCIKDIKKKFSNTRKKKTDLTVLLKESILINHEKNGKKRALEKKKKMEEKLGLQGTDPLYTFFMTVYRTTAKMPPASQHTIKREVFRIVSDAEETLLGMSP